VPECGQVIMMIMIIKKNHNHLKKSVFYWINCEIVKIVVGLFAF